MFKFYSVLLCLIFNFQVISQGLTHIADLPISLKESSGLLYLNNSVISINDSGNDPNLYSVNPITGNILREVNIANTNNVDWEDLAMDESFIYIGDFGNNNGNRTDLKIYKISINDYLLNDTVSSEVIEFSFSDQLDFNQNPFATNHDAEALIAYGDSLYVFTKNWIDSKCNVYSVAKDPGSFVISKIDSFNTNGYVSAADFNVDDSTVILSSYDFNSAKLIELKNFKKGQFFSGSITNHQLIPLTGYSIQFEGVCFENSSNYFISSEQFLNDKSALYSFLSPTNNLDEEAFKQPEIFPNPSSGIIYFQNLNNEKVVIKDLLGNTLRVATENYVDLSALPKGIYYCYFQSSHTHITKLILQ